MTHLETETDLHAWLANLKLANLKLADRADVFLAAGWRGDKLLELSREDLADLGVPKDQRGAVMLAVEALRQGDAPPTLPDPRAPNYAPALTETAIARYQALGRNPPEPWVAAVAEAWPGPIAHEYQRLRQLLEQGQIVAAIFQLKDLAEVLVKFPALVMARDLIEHGDPAAARAARRALFGGALSMGHWVNAIVREQLAPQVLRLADRLLLPELGAGFVTANPAGKLTSTPWLETLKGLVNWRNETLGHGAFHLDPQDYLPDLEKYVRQINRHLAEQVETGLWAGVVLRGETGTPPLTGWRAIRHWHDGEAGTHGETEAPLVLERAGRTLRLTPLVALRRCAVCAKQDVFLYDTASGRDLLDGFILLDYLSGHRLSVPLHRAGALATETHDPDGREWTPAGPGLLDDDYGERAINELLETKLLEARYLRPDYLREPLRRFVDARDRGVFWLTAPSHTGKSVFAHGLALPAEVGDKPLWPDTAVVVFHIRREFKTWPEQLRHFILETVLHQAFGREPGRLRLPELDVRATDPAAALARLLHEAFRLKPDRIRRLMLILDGLDELPPNPEGEAGIADFIPRPEALPDGCFLLLTSRPLAECPPHVRRALADRFAGCADFAGYELTLDDAGGDAYRRLLRAYFDRELADRLKAELHQALAGVVRGRTTVSYRNDLNRLQPPKLASFAQQEWTDLTRRVRVRSPADAPSLKETVVQPLLDRYTAAFAAVLDKATGRFLYVAHLTELLRDGRLEFAGIAELPAGAGLYAHYLRQLERTLAAPGVADADAGSKPWEFARRVILTLAAAEQAHVAYRQLLPASIRDEEFRGVPLAILAALLDEPGRTVRLTFTLYSLKNILAVWKGEDARDARYALGLKDFVATVAALWPEALTDTHRLLATQTLAALEGRWESVGDDDPLDRWRLQYLVAHVGLAEKPAYRERLIGEAAIPSAYHRLGMQAHSGARYALAAQYWSIRLAVAQQRVLLQPGDDAMNDLAGAYMNRGVTRGDGQDLSGALADYGQAIELREALRRQLGAEWPPEWANGLACSYAGRAVTHANGSDLVGAQADYDAAIALMEALRQRLGTDWLPLWANQLAGVYMHQGITHADGGDLAGAQADYDLAIALGEDLRQRLGTDWPLGWVNQLAEVYMNRGIARRASGDPAGARADYDLAIALGEDLRQRLGTDWPPAWVNDLAIVYRSRGIVRRANGNIAEARADFDAAIALQEELCQRLKTDWPPGWGNDLARVYENRGKVRDDSGDPVGARADYDAAIALMEALQQRLGADWPPAWSNDLSAVYTNRGSARLNSGDPAGAQADYDAAIALMEALQQRLGADWPPAWANNLAGVYMNRGVARDDSSDPAGARADYDAAIALMEDLRQRSGMDWPSAWANHLARVYTGRGIVLKNIGRLEDALADWDKTAEICLKLVQRRQLQAGTQLLGVILMQLDGYQDLGLWTEATRCFLQFMAFQTDLETQWNSGENSGAPPWQSITDLFAEMVHGLDLEQRTALLDALGEEAERVKEVFGWE
jgi:tetratricopeptide (TPR) repeat protein